MIPSTRPASIIIPTYREAPNIKTLIERIFAALSLQNREAEVVFVDDNSQDGIEEIVKELRGTFPITLIVRRGERGLCSAVLEGFRRSHFEQLVVMDADLQHPPEMVPVMLERLERGDCDFVIASRYCSAGKIDREWPWLRRVISRLSSGLARPLAPLSDPMTGFFALHRSTWEQSAALRPVGYKIALELYVKGGCSRPAEVPIEFGVRYAGQSKANIREGLRFLHHLIRLYWFRYPWLIVVLVLVVGLAGATYFLSR